MKTTPWTGANDVISFVRQHKKVPMLIGETCWLKLSWSGNRNYIFTTSSSVRENLCISISRESIKISPVIIYKTCSI